MISEQCSVKEKRLVLSARLEEDLGVTGDDAVELMQAFSSIFNVELTDLEFSKHFGPEALFSRRHPELGAYPVTVGHLVNVAEHGHWFPPPRVSA